MATFHSVSSGGSLCTHPRRTCHVSLSIPNSRGVHPPPTCGPTLFFLFKGVFQQDWIKNNVGILIFLERGWGNSAPA
jgi:hypothetical protein